MRKLCDVAVVCVTAAYVRFVLPELLRPEAMVADDVMSNTEIELTATLAELDVDQMAVRLAAMDAPTSKGELTPAKLKDVNDGA